MIINVAIPTYRPDKKLREIIRRLNQQTVKLDTILIVNTVREWVDEQEYSEFNNVKFIHIEKCEFDHGATRNMAMEKLDGDITVFMTQDAMPSDIFLIERLIQPIIDDDMVAITYARQLPCKGASPIEVYTREFNYPAYDIETTKESVEVLGIKAYFCSDVCAAYRNTTFEEIGGFPGRIIFNEDAVYASKILEASYKKVYVSAACVYHSHNYTVFQQFTRNFDLGVSHRQFSYIFKTELMKTEQEGIKLVSKTAKYLLSNNHALLLPELLLLSAAKLLGYRLGKMYDKLPDKAVLLCSMNTDYWTGRK